MVFNKNTETGAIRLIFRRIKDMRKGTKKKDTGKELTLCYTVEVTEILKNVEDAASPEEIKPVLERAMKKRLGVDDLHIKKLQVFLVEKEE